MFSDWFWQDIHNHRWCWTLRWQGLNSKIIIIHLWVLWEGQWANLVLIPTKIWKTYIFIIHTLILKLHPQLQLMAYKFTANNRSGINIKLLWVRLVRLVQLRNPIYLHKYNNYVINMFFYSIQEQSLLLIFPTWKSIMKMAMTFWIPNMKLQNWKIYRKFVKALQEILLCFILPDGLSCLQIVWININQIKLTVKCLKSWPQPLLWRGKNWKIVFCAVFVLKPLGLV